MSVESAVVLFVAAIAYSIVVWLPKRIRPGDPETFDVRKFLKALIVGVVVAAYAYSTGVELSLTSFPDLVTASGATLVAERVVTFIFRALKQARAAG